jgi:hypothetical protein
MKTPQIKNKNNYDSKTHKIYESSPRKNPVTPQPEKIRNNEDSLT